MEKTKTNGLIGSTYCYQTILSKTKNISDDYTVVFVKPGIGYYACIVIHKNDLITDAWFEDRSD